MPDEFYAALEQYDIDVTITDYPIKLHLPEEIKQKPRLHFTGNFAHDGFWSHYFVDKQGRLDPEKNFRFCNKIGGRCFAFCDGKLGVCAMPWTLPALGKYFDIPALLDFEQDKINIDGLDSKAVLRRLNMALEACRYCDLAKTEASPPIDWRISDRSLAEFGLNN
jgi:hypothetical protein